MSTTVSISGIFELNAAKKILDRISKGTTIVKIPVKNKGSIAVDFTEGRYVPIHGVNKVDLSLSGCQVTELNILTKH